MTDPRTPKQTVCVLDDNLDALQSLQFLLECHGFLVRAFSAAVALLVSINPDDVDCLVIDYKMPHMDGLDVAIRLRQRNISAPIILVTGYDDEQMTEKATAAGINHVLFKPHLEDSLVRRIRDVIAR